MAYILGYTKKGDKYYCSGNDANYPGLVALNCDVNDALHIAHSHDGKNFIPLRNNTGILFPKADLNTDVVGGVTKILMHPWIFRTQEGSFGICAVRRNQNTPDSLNKGCIMLFFSDDMIHFSEEQFLKADENEIKNPHCYFDHEEGMYYIEWANNEGVYCGYTSDFENINEIKKLDVSGFESCDDFGIEDALPGNVIEISGEEEKKILGYLGCIYNVDVKIPVLKTNYGKPIEFDMFPGAMCIYNDGSEHEKKVDWNKEDYQKVDCFKPGTYIVGGEIIQAKYDFPFCDISISDPYIFFYQNQYYLIILDLNGETSVLAGRSNTIEGLKDASFTKILYDKKHSSSKCGNWWAPELHIIEGIPYIFTTVGTTNWNTTQSCIYKCEGDIMNPEDWIGPYLVVKPDGRPIRPDGVSLDMTYFCMKETHYVMWSDRKWADLNKELEPTVQDTADIYIATVNPQKPWELTVDPVCVHKPVYGWERYESKVEEGPYLLQHGDDLFVTISCSSTALTDLYCVGMLYSNVNKDLLSAAAWDFLHYPVVTKESIPGEYGPGHNCFVKDLDNGDDLFVYHAVPHDECKKAMGRYMGIRRVHWGSNGYPYLEMTEERDVNPTMRKVVLMIEVI